MLATGPRLGVDLVDRIAPARLPAPRRPVADQRLEVGPHQLEQEEVPLLPPIEAPHDHAGGHGVLRPLHEHEHALAHGLVELLVDDQGLLDGQALGLTDGEGQGRATIARPENHGVDDELVQGDQQESDGDENESRIHDASSGLGPRQ